MKFKIVNKKDNCYCIGAFIVSLKNIAKSEKADVNRLTLSDFASDYGNFIFTKNRHIYSV